VKIADPSPVSSANHKNTVSAEKVFILSIFTRKSATV